MKKYTIEKIINSCGKCHFCQLMPHETVARQVWLVCCHPKIKNKKIWCEYINSEDYNSIPYWCPLEDVEKK